MAALQPPFIFLGYLHGQGKLGYLTKLLLLRLASHQKERAQRRQQFYLYFSPLLCASINSYILSCLSLSQFIVQSLVEIKLNVNTLRYGYNATPVKRQIR